MPHALYHSEGLILSSRYHGEADIVYQILSPQLGLITALATGARYAKSKLRPHLRELDYAKITLVRGKDIWRLTAAEREERLRAIFAGPEKHAVWARIALLLRRLVRGEEPQPGLFNDLLAGLEHFGSDQIQSTALYEQVLVVRLLAALGYVGSDSEIASWLAPTLWSESDWAVGPETSAVLLRHINHGLHHSQL
jgi:DNA repair protein RecO